MAARTDAEAIARIYNQAIAERTATFETRPRAAEEVASWFDGRHPIVTVEDDSGAPVAFAATFEYRPRECYAGIAEVSVYVAREARGRGAGHVALAALIQAARERGYWKLLSRVFPENTTSRALIRTAGFREVGTYHRHGRLEGAWRDVIIVERVIPENCT